MLPRLRNPGDLEPLLALLPDGAVVAELGVFAGDGTRQILACPAVARVYCVDFWTGGYDPGDLASNADMAEAEAAFEALAASDPRAIKVRATTLEAVGLVPAGLDLVYVDADHRADAVAADLRAWLPRLKAGGWIAGHDYTDPAHLGVREAVRAVLGEPDHVFPDGSWAVRVTDDLYCPPPGL